MVSPNMERSPISTSNNLPLDGYSACYTVRFFFSVERERGYSVAFCVIMYISLGLPLGTSFFLTVEGTLQSIKFQLYCLRRTPVSHEAFVFWKPGSHTSW